MIIKINNEQALFAQVFEGGCTSYGFQNLFRSAKRFVHYIEIIPDKGTLFDRLPWDSIFQQKSHSFREVDGKKLSNTDLLQTYFAAIHAQWSDCSNGSTSFVIPEDFIQEGEIGTIEQYVKKEALQNIGYELQNLSRWPKVWFEESASPALQSAILNCLEQQCRVRVFFGNPKTGEVALEEYDVTGTIGVTTGLCKTPMVCNRGSGSSFVDGSNVLRIVEIRTNEILYSVPNVIFPTLKMKKGPLPEYPFEVYEVMDDKSTSLQARFPTEDKAQAWIDFMLGNSMEL